MRWIVVVFGIYRQLAWGEAQIPPMYQLVAEEQRVPAKLLYAVVLNESRSLVRGDEGKKVLPWPWTINHRGKSHYFESRLDAYEFATALINQGDTHFDVGLGQSNWYWQQDRYKSVWDAFDPYTNLTVTAKILREQYDRPECNRWELAVGCYHRPGQRKKDKRVAREYMKRVITLWASI